MTERLLLVAALLACGCARQNPEFNTGGVQPARCGDGLCSASGGESCLSCPVDCGGCQDCRPGFADCNHNPIDGCETNITTNATCGGCGNPCIPHGGTSSCVPSGGGFVCKVTCDATHVDCDGDPANGCEASFTNDPGDAPATCPGSHLTTVDEGSAESFDFGRILPAGDVDVYNLQLKEATKPCSPAAVQKYNAKITLVDPSGSGLQLGLPADVTICSNQWPNMGTSFCIDWEGTCAVDDSRNLYFEVHGGNPSCRSYTVTVEYCAEGTVCSGC
jgi:hypothetical protein